MFVSAVCFLFLLKLKWPKDKSVYRQQMLCSVHHAMFCLSRQWNVDIRGILWMLSIFVRNLCCSFDCVGAINCIPFGTETTGFFMYAAVALLSLALPFLGKGSEGLCVCRLHRSLSIFFCLPKLRCSTSFVQTIA